MKFGLRFPKLGVLAAALMVIPAWFLFNHVKTGFMPDMDEGAFVLDYVMPSGTSLQEKLPSAAGWLYHGLAVTAIAAYMPA